MFVVFILMVDWLVSEYGMFILVNVFNLYNLFVIGIILGVMFICSLVFVIDVYWGVINYKL